MQTRNTVAGAILGIASSAVLLFAYASGPDARYTAALETVRTLARAVTSGRH